MMAPSSVIVLDSDEETEPTSKRKKRVDPKNVNKRQKLSHNPSTIKKHKPLIVALDSRLLLADKSEPKNSEGRPKSPAIGSSASQVHSHGDSNVSLPLPGDTMNGILDGTLKRFLDSSLLQDQSLMKMFDKMSPDVFLNSTSVLNESNINLSQLDVSQLLNSSLLDQTFSLAGEKTNISYFDSLLASVEAQPSAGMQAGLTTPSEVTLPVQNSEIPLMPNQKSLIPITVPSCLETVQHSIPQNIAPPVPLFAPPFYPTVANQALGSQLLGNLNLLAQLHLQSLLASTLHASNHMASLSGYRQHAGFQNPSQPGDGCSLEKDGPTDGPTNIISIEPVFEHPGDDVSGGGGTADGDLGTFSRSFVSVAPVFEEISNEVMTNDETNTLLVSRNESLDGKDDFDVQGALDVFRSIENTGADISNVDEDVEKPYVDVNKVDDVDGRSVDVDQIANTSSIPVNPDITEEITNTSMNSHDSFHENIVDKNVEVNDVDEIDYARENINNVAFIGNLVATTEAMKNVATSLTPNVDDMSKIQIDDHTTDPSSGCLSINDDNDGGDDNDDIEGGVDNDDIEGREDGDFLATDRMEDNLRPGVFEGSGLVGEVSKFSDGDSMSSKNTENDPRLCSENHEKSHDIESRHENSIKTNLCKTISPPASESSETSDSEIPVDIIQPTDRFLTEKFAEYDKVSTSSDLLNGVRSPFKVEPETTKTESICGGDGDAGTISVKEDLELDISSVKKEVKSEPRSAKNQETNYDILVQPKQEEHEIMEKPTIKRELADRGPSEEYLEVNASKSAHLVDEPKTVSTPTPSKSEVAAPSRRVSIPLSVLQDLDMSSFSASLNVESKSVPCYNCRQNVTRFAKCSSSHNCCLLCLFDKIKIWLVSNSKDVFACEHPNCTSFYKIAELRQVLPEMIVEIMEEKLEREYVASTNVFLKKVNTKSMPIAPLKLGTDDWWPQYDRWDQMDHDKPYCLIDVNKSSKEFEKVSKLFHKTMTSPRAKIKAIRKLLNPALWQYYNMRKEQSMRHLSHVKHQLERMLFHGIKRKFLDIVCLENVDWRKCGISHGILFGDGTYFARDASYAHQYTDKHFPAPSRRECDVDEALNRCLEEKENVDSNVDPLKTYEDIKRLMSQRLWEILDDKTTQSDPSLHSRFMLVARVFVGRYTVGRMNMRKPPPLDPTDPYGPCYDSLVNYADRPTLFVMSDVHQHYPEYVIEYTNQPRERTSSSTSISSDNFWFD